MMTSQWKDEATGDQLASALRYLCIAPILIALGLIFSGYLLARTFLILAEATLGKIDFCAKVLGSSCDSILASSDSWKLGIPLAGWGVVYYLTLGSLLLLGRLLGSAFDSEAKSAALGLTVVGACMSVFLGLEMLLGWVPVCQLCLVIHLINFALVAVLRVSSGPSFRQLLSAAENGLQVLLGPRTSVPTETRWKAVGLTTVVLVAIVAYQWVYVQSTVRRLAEHRPPDIEPLLAVFESEPQQRIEVTANDPQLGLPEAPMQLVVFSNFQCPGCQDFAGQLDRLLKGAEHKLRIVFKHFPLGTACDAEVPCEQLPQICSVAMAAQAAHEQDKFWQFHNALFSGDLDADQNELRRIARDVGLDQERFEADWQAPTTRAKVHADVELGERLNVSGTPTVFLNGRRIRELNVDAIDMLIHYQADAHSNSAAGP